MQIVWSFRLQTIQNYDPLHGIALIYEIQGNYEKAVNTYDRILENLKEEQETVI